MKTFKAILFIFFLACISSCKSNSEEGQEIKATGSEHEIQVQGHRGDRGNFPENTLPAFKSAVEKGVDVLELDVVISGDKKVVVSHEPYMSSLFVTTPSGDFISQGNERSFNLYKMTYDSIKKFDVGSRGNVRFPNQKKIKTYKPLLSEVIDSIEAFVAAEGLPPVQYNIEIKSVKTEYGEYQPQPKEFIELVMKVLKEKGIGNKINIQSFDPKILNLIKKTYPEVELSFLVSKQGIVENLSLLNFIPEIYSPDFKLVKNDKFVDSIKSLQMMLIPWTVNEKENIQRMINLKVDGIITDYPERVLEIKKSDP